MESTSVIQQKGLPKTNPPYRKGEIPLYHRSREKPLDPTTLSSLFQYPGLHWPRGLVHMRPPCPGHVQSAEVDEDLGTPFCGPWQWRPRLRLYGKSSTCTESFHLSVEVTKEAIFNTAGKHLLTYCACTGSWLPQHCHVKKGVPAEIDIGSLPERN